jgi:hypothetical protein
MNSHHIHSSPHTTSEPQIIRVTLTIEREAVLWADFSDGRKIPLGPISELGNWYPQKYSVGDFLDWTATVTAVEANDGTLVFYIALDDAGHAAIDPHSLPADGFAEFITSFVERGCPAEPATREWLDEHRKKYDEKEDRAQNETEERLAQQDVEFEKKELEARFGIPHPGDKLTLEEEAAMRLLVGRPRACKAVR